MNKSVNFPCLGYFPDCSVSQGSPEINSALFTFIMSDDVIQMRQCAVAKLGLLKQ